MNSKLSSSSAFTIKLDFRQLKPTSFNSGNASDIEITLSDEESCLFMTSDNNSLDFEDNQQLEEPSIEIEQIELGELIS